MPETEPARSHYKELVEAKANVRACQVLQDIGQGMLETQLEAVNNVATEMTMAGLEEFQKDVQVINSGAFQCLPVAAVNLVSRVFGARRIGDPLPIALENAAKALGASESEAKKLSDDAMVAPKRRNCMSRSPAQHCQSSQIARVKSKKILDDAIVAATKRNYLSLREVFKIVEDDFQLAMRGDVLTEENL